MNLTMLRKALFTPYFMGLITVLFFSFTAISCKKDVAVVEPAACLTCDRDKLLGAYIVTKGCTLLDIKPGLPSNITAGSANNAIIIDSDINATVSGSSFTLVKQIINGYVLSGNGSLGGKSLTMTITLTQGTSSSSCVVTFEKQ